MSPLAVWSLVLVTAAADSAPPAAPGKPVGALTAPTRDQDADSIPDDRDKCPNEPEDHDGVLDEDGCPDTPTRPIHVPPFSIQDRILFAPNKATVPEASSLLLDAIAAALKGNPQAELTAVQGRTDKSEAPRLALARARAVVRELERRGVEPSRLVAQPIRQRDPPCPAGVDCRPHYRRVQFAILKRAEEGKTP